MRDETYYTVKIAESSVPQHMHGGVLRYLLHGLPPGSFLTAVLSNDLAEACARADEKNKHALWAYVDFLYNYAPVAAWGSPEKVGQWIASFRQAAIEAGSQR